MSALERLRELVDAEQSGIVEMFTEDARALLAVAEATGMAGAKQQEAVAIIRENGFVFDGPLGREPGNWQQLAFTFYTMLCEIEAHVNPALAALESADQEDDGAEWWAGDRY